MNTTNNSHPFETLTPDFIMDAIESQGYLCDGRNLALNSYENRVYQIGIEDGLPIIAKFYRPNRWTKEQILEEHAFSYELAEQELPIVTPLKNNADESLFQYRNFSISLFERKGGHAPELDYKDNLLILGRLLARMHLIGSTASFEYRPSININNYGYDSVKFISENFIPSELKLAYDSLTKDVLNAMEQSIARAGSVKSIRVHGDCHAGNMLWRDDNPNFVDFDDSRMAPAVQDIWMLLSGSREQQGVQLNKILDGYFEFNDFDMTELQLIEVFRTLRIMNYSAWLARRWADPAFPHSFPWFNTTRYWEEHILELREQFSAINEPAIRPL
ncbi:MAG: serine/threonine protein kinase [Gammaproteobacteria bacterium]|jgi:Ser/Thr protein kinase RdoA (MazF antagonist)|nr:serine/threonine protein kinase [Gammaproteobacteria bacterium]MBT3724677.1 serine/threonine protein kinase [Gammaproteobacteria bacterium]MBT4077048.1 serine/threonine protein kinase [Gammaproteobacteria bacterium]MBT4193343.1 serine/threonine protein kinase [Gammaproteobacteria bacterium]MBT4449163.1 serine/threonine protein kinase [Gammaproteobacteria bacterium]